MTTLDVLIVDDEESIRQLYTDAFTLAGLKVLTADTSDDAVAKALQYHPRVILMDILLGNDTGHSAVEKIRRDDWGKNARIIYLTNLTEPENVVKAISLQPEEYIVKAHTDVKDVVNQARMAMYKSS